MVEELGVGISRLLPKVETKTAGNSIDLDAVDILPLDEEIETDQSRAIKKVKDEFA